MPKQKTASLNGYGVTEVTPYPVKTRGFHHFLILLFYDHPAKGSGAFLHKGRSRSQTGGMGGEARLQCSGPPN